MVCLAPIYLRESGISAPCGTCPGCRQKLKKDWSFRLYQEYKYSYTSSFLTLTYDENHVPTWVDQSTGEIKTNLKVKDVQNFIKRVRNAQSKYYQEHKKRPKWAQHIKEEHQIRYYAVGEYGTETDRAHYHIMLFNCEPDILNRIEHIWKKGHVHTGTCNAKTIAYTLKYVLKTPSDRWGLKKPSRIDMVEGKERQHEFSVMSRRPAIGHMYLKKNGMYHKKSRSVMVRDINQAPQELPKYYRNKIFNIKEKELLSAKKLEVSDKKFKSKEEKIKALGNNPEKIYVDQVRDYLRKMRKVKNKKRKL